MWNREILFVHVFAQSATSKCGSHLLHLKESRVCWTKRINTFRLNLAANGIAVNNVYKDRGVMYTALHWCYVQYSLVRSVQCSVCISRESWGVQCLKVVYCSRVQCSKEHCSTRYVSATWKGEHCGADIRHIWTPAGFRSGPNTPNSCACSDS